MPSLVYHRERVVQEYGRPSPRSAAVRRVLLVLGHVLLAGPDDLHGPLELLGQLGGLARDGGGAAAVAAEAAAEEHGMDEYILDVAAGLVGGELERRGLVLRR